MGWETWEDWEAWEEGGGSSPAPATYSISGTITGDEVSGVTVSLTGDATDSVVTGVGGTFSFADLPPGDYVLTPTLAGYTFAPESINVTVVAADKTDQDFVSSLITYTLSGVITQETFTISGTIVDGADAGIEGVTVALSGDASDSVLTDGSGNYSFTDLGSGSYTVTPTFDNLQMTPASRAANVSGDDVEVDDIVGQYLLLPFTYEISDLAPTSGLISQLDDWYTKTGADTSGNITTSSLEDSNSFTPTGTTKGLLDVWDGSPPNEGNVFLLPYQISPSLTSIRWTFLARDTASANRPGQSSGLLDVWWIAQAGTRDATLIGSVSGNPNPDTVLAQGIYDTTDVYTEINNVSTGVNIAATRWHWYRFEWNFVDDKVYASCVRAEDSAAIYSLEAAINAAGQSLGHVPSDLTHFGLWAAEASVNTLISKFWIGTASDDWPT